MSHDIFLGKTKHNWSRTAAPAALPFAPQTSREPLTEKEKERIEKLAQLEMLATRGDVAAQKKMVEVNAAIAALQKHASHGDAKAQRILSTLRESGLVTLNESKTGPRLVMAGVAPRTKRSSRATVNTTAQVQQFLIALKMKAMAGDPQSINVLRNYQQIVDPPASQSTAQPSAQPTAQPSEQTFAQSFTQPSEQPSEQPFAQSATPQTPSSPDQFQQQTLSTEAPQTYPPRYPSNSQQSQNLIPNNSQPSSAGSFIGFNGHLAFIRGLGEEEVALAREGGACERAALRRRY